MSSSVVMTVLGPVAAEGWGVVDAHNHLYIGRVVGGPRDAPVLTDVAGVARELAAFRRLGGGGIVDCQPGRCGRDGRVLRALSAASGVHVVAATGFHRRRYYPADEPLFGLGAEAAADYFLSEIREGLEETRRDDGRPTTDDGRSGVDDGRPTTYHDRNETAIGEREPTGLAAVVARQESRRPSSVVNAAVVARQESRRPSSVVNAAVVARQESRRLSSVVFPGVIKIAAEATLDASPGALFEAAAAVAGETGLAVEVHTEQGAAVEALLAFFAGRGVAPERLVFCHVDKRPDFGLHRELAQAGVLLEYDTFYRPKYDPERGVWPLLGQMAAAGLAGQVTLATDMADPAMWAELGGGPGLPGLFTVIQARLRRMGLADETIAGLLGGNIMKRIGTSDE